MHQLRHQVDALITGSGTVLTDKPQLTDRTGLPRRRPLLPVILDRRGRVSDFPGALIFQGTLPELTDKLWSIEIQSFLLECGPDLAFNAIRSSIIDKIVLFIAPKILGGREVPAIGGEGIEKLSEAMEVEGWSLGPSGTDFVLTAYVHRDH